MRLLVGQFFDREVGREIHLDRPRLVRFLPHHLVHEAWQKIIGCESQPELLTALQILARSRNILGNCFAVDRSLEVDHHEILQCRATFWDINKVGGLLSQPLDGSIDFGVLTFDPRQSDLRFVTLGRDELVLLLPPAHPLYSSVYRLDPKPRLRAVTNGARLLLVHSPTDVAKSWQLRDEKKDRAQFELGVNLFVYAAGKRDYRNRLDSPYLPDPSKAPLGRVKVARLSYAGGHWLKRPAPAHRI